MNTEPSTPAAATPATAPVDPGADVEALKKSFEAVRNHLRKTGVALGAVATTVIGGLGYARLHDLFPIPEGDNWLYAVAGAAAAAAVLGAALLASRFFGAQRRILLSSQLPGSWRERRRRGFTSREIDIVTALFTDHAREEEAVSLHALELRALRLDRMARRATGSGQRERFSQEARRLSAVVRLALIRGVASVLEHRAQRAFTGWISKGALIVAAAGIVALWGAADYSKGQRDLIDLRAKCADAESKGATSACEPVVEAEDDKAAQASRDAAKRKQTQAVEAAARDLTPTSRGSVARADACNTVVGSRLKGAVDAVRAAAVAACIGP